MPLWSKFNRKPQTVEAYRTPPSGEPKSIAGGEAGPNLVEYTPGDWIIRTEDGVVFSCSDKAFVETYVPFIEALPEAPPEVQTEPTGDVNPDAEGVADEGGGDEGGEDPIL